MGHTVYYIVKVEDWDDFIDFLLSIENGLGLRVMVKKEEVVILSPCSPVEPLTIPKEGEGFAKTNLVEPCHSIYLLLLHSVSSFGSVELWEDER